LSHLLLGVYDASDRCGLSASYDGPRSDERDVLCLFDGHLDNGPEIAAELCPAGATNPPAVLLAEGYRRWGLGLPSRMRGDFVLLVWDREKCEGLIARDQLGVRPAYLHREGGLLRFASELQPLLAALPRRPPPDRAGVAHWITASRRPGTGTLYAGVDRLGAGEMVVLEPGGARIVRYWEPRYEEPLDLPAEELAERVHAALRAAVGRRLATDAPTGVLLSGGLDSSAVAAVAVEVGGGDRVRACSAAFPDHPVADEAELIAELRGSLGLAGPLVAGRASGLVESALAYTGAWGVPLLGWGDFWTLPLLRAAAGEGVATVLGGDGGDELFGPRQNLIAEALRKCRPRWAMAVAGSLPGAGPQVPRRDVAAMLASQALLALPLPLHRRVVDWRERRRLPGWLLPSTAQALRDTDDPVAWKRLDGPLWWADVAHGIAQGLDEAGIFEHQRNRAQMAAVEARHPLLDLDLVGLCLRQAPAATLDRRFTRPVLRQSVAGLVPDSVRLRPGKARFESLVVDCLTGAEMPTVRRLLTGPEAAIREYVDQERVGRELLDGAGDPEPGSFHWMWLVWRLLTAEVWLRSESAGLQLFPTLTERDERSRIPPNLMVDTLNQKRSSRQ